MNLIEEMNPRIIELLEQSGFMEIIEDHANEFGSGISDAEYPEFYKFVELIINECLEQGDALANHYSNTLPPMPTLPLLLVSIADYSSKIKKHFGVKS